MTQIKLNRAYSINGRVRPAGSTVDVSGVAERSLLADGNEAIQNRGPNAVDPEAERAKAEAEKDAGKDSEEKAKAKSSKKSSSKKK